MAKLEIQADSLQGGCGVHDIPAGSTSTALRVEGSAHASTVYMGQSDGTEGNSPHNNISEEDMDALAAKWYNAAMSAEDLLNMATDVAEIAICIAKREISATWVCAECLKINLRRKTKCSTCGVQRGKDNGQDKDSSGAERLL